MADICVPLLSYVHSSKILQNSDKSIAENTSLSYTEKLKFLFKSDLLDNVKMNSNDSNEAEVEAAVKLGIDGNENNSALNIIGNKCRISNEINKIIEDYHTKNTIPTTHSSLPRSLPLSVTRENYPHLNILGFNNYVKKVVIPLLEKYRKKS